MNSHCYPWNQRRRVVATIVATFVGGLFAAAPARAIDKEAEAQRDRMDYVQARFLEDSEPAVPSQRMAATPCVAGFAGVYPCNKVDLMAFMPLSTIGGGSGNDVWGWTDPLDGREYALMGRSTGTAFVDITDPANPIYVGNLPGRGASSSWRDIKVYANHAYIGSESSGHGMQIFDLTGLRGVVSPPVQFAETAHYGNFGASHNLAINEDSGFAYAVGTNTCSGGPHFIDLSNPVVPVFAGCHVEPSYTHDTQCVIYSGPDAVHQGREICINSNTNRINIIDVTDKAAPTVISSTTYSGTGYTHQGWLTEDQQYYMQGDELDEQNLGHPTRTRIFDVRDLDLPVLIGTYDGSTNAIDHNLYTHNGFMYQANYRAGLQIFDLADVANGNLTEVASFDVYPSSNTANFNGAWSNYPYFPSGTVVISGIEQGLFIVRPVLDPDFDLTSDFPDAGICDPGQASVQLTLTARNDYAGSVGLTTSGLPIGATASATPPSVTLPDPTPTSALTLDTAGAAPGIYALTVTASDGVISKDLALTLNVADSVPAAPAPVSPVDSAIDVSRTPTLSWSAAAQATSYVVEVATDAGFGTLVFSRSTTATSTIVDTGLSELTPHFWRVRALNACGIGVNSAVFGFTTLEVPRILLVDDDDNGPDVRATYTATLNALGEDFDIWDTNNTDDEPNAVALAPYDIVIWFTGDEFGGAAGPGAGGEQALQSWLDESACLLIASQDYYYDRGLTSFMASHLAVGTITSDQNHSEVTGLGTVFGGLGTYILAPPYTNYTDDMTILAAGEIAFAGDQGRAAVDKDGGIYRTSYWSFGLEMLPTVPDQEAALSTMINWCDGLAPPDADSDGTEDSLDCAVSDPDLWTAPSSASNLRVDGVGQDTLTWSPSAMPGGTTLLYDVMRSGLVDDFAASFCVETGDTDTQALDGTLPIPGELFAYLIRARNDCGAAMGQGTTSGARNGGTCP